MEVKIILVKKNDAGQSEMNFDDLSIKEQKMEGICLKKRFFEILGYIEKSEPPA
ncbi:MAG: hypothetical protein HFI71_08170 [Lachnospiraceae bacterium]|jgi:hypothetical protein|nr:hypothetical protein [Lachnospiraceae bacterium]